MTDESVADFAARADHDAEESRRQAGFLENFRQQQSACHGISHRQGRRDGAVAQVQWPVPRTDRADDADRFASHLMFLARNVGRNDAAFDGVGHRGGPSMTV
jgi:hypothetical protein